MKALKIIILSLAAVLILASCAEPSSYDFYQFQRDFLSSYSMLKDNSATDTRGISRAVAPVWSTGDGAKALADGASYTVTDYPEVGQITTWTYTDMSATASDLWKVTAVTDYPNDANIDNTVEIYYILDDHDEAGNAGADGYHDWNDSYTDASGTPDTLYRDQFRTYFADNTHRIEAIAEDFGSVQYDINDFLLTGSLDYDSVSVNAGTGTTWNSMVEYSHNMKDGFDYSWWSDIKRASMNGERYYAEAADGTKYYLIKEYGVAKRASWDETVVPNLPTGNHMFEGVLRIKIDTDGTKTIAGKYVIDNGVIIHIDNNIVTME